VRAADSLARRNDVSLEINGKSVFVAEWGDNSLAAYDLAYPFPAPARPGGPGASRARKSAALTRQPGKAGKVKVTVHLDLVRLYTRLRTMHVDEGMTLLRAVRQDQLEPLAYGRSHRHQGPPVAQGHQD
jgi:hypothetical protein